MTSTVLATLPEWQALQKHQKQINTQKMAAWFAEDPERFAKFSLRCGDLLFDYSKNRLTSDTLALLIRLSQALDLPAKIRALFSAEPMNLSEARPALHTALRSQSKTAPFLEEQEPKMLVKRALDKMGDFVQAVREGSFRGASGQSIQDVVNIGIGGSHLGPLMTTQALAAYADSTLRFHFISDVDELALQEVWEKLNPDRTLFIISSKSFTTIETLVNAESCRQWLQKKLGRTALHRHFVAVTAQQEKAKQWGLPEEQIFPIWAWVGGRYSVWSAIGLPLALQIGMAGFQAFLAGAEEADHHFYTKPLNENIPVLMGLIGIWYLNFFQAKTQAIVPYTHRLKHLRAYLQQLDMESNGKCMTGQGVEADYSTGPIVWGELGIHGQHAFHQLLHQGTHVVPIDFIIVGQQNAQETALHQDLLIANALSQAKALMYGKKAEEIYQELLAEGWNAPSALLLAKHKEIPGNRPSSILFMHQLTAHNLGLLLAFYEHKIFVQSVIWNVNPFDQWGVELGKAILPSVLKDLREEPVDSHHDSSTRNLIAYYKNGKTVEGIRK